MYIPDDESEQSEFRDGQSLNIVQIPGFIRDFKEYSGSINTKMLKVLKNQFESDPNTCVIKDEVAGLSDNEDSFMSAEENDTVPIMQTTLKLRYLMEKYKMKDESYLGNAIIKESLNSYIYNMNKRQIISKQFRDNSELIRQERDALTNISANNVIDIRNRREGKNEKIFDFAAFSKRGMNSGQPDSEPSKQKEIHAPHKLKQWQKEINCLNHSNYEEYLRTRKNEEEEAKQEFQEKFRLNKVFQFKLNRAPGDGGTDGNRPGIGIGNATGTGNGPAGRSNVKLEKQSKQEAVDRYQDNIEERLPPDIDSISQNIVEYIDLTGQGNLQPQHLVDLKEDISQVMGNTQSTQPNFEAMKANAIYLDFIETFSSVIEENKGVNLDLLTFQREISPIARMVVKGNKLKQENFEEVEMIKNNENELNLEEMRDEDIWNIISGRINSQSLVEKYAQLERIKRKLSKSSDRAEKGDSKEQIAWKLNEIRNNLTQKGKMESQTQACIAKNPQTNKSTNSNRDQFDALNTSYGSRLSRSQKSDRSLSYNTQSNNNPSNKRSVSQSQLASRNTSQNLINTSFDSSGQKESYFRRNQTLSMQPSLRQPQAQQQKKGTQYLSISSSNASKRKGSRMSEKDELSSIHSLREVDEEQDENQYSEVINNNIVLTNSQPSQNQQQQQQQPQQQYQYLQVQQSKEEDASMKYSEILEEVDSLESEHNRLLRLIISAQISPEIYALCEEIKQLRMLKSQIMKSQNVNEALAMTKYLNSNICSKLKQMLQIVFQGNSDFETGLQDLLNSVHRINSKSNSVEQGRLKLAFVLLSDFKAALLGKSTINSSGQNNNKSIIQSQNAADISQIASTQQPQYQYLDVRQIEDSLEQLNKKKQLSKSQQNKLDKELDYNKLSFFNFRKEKQQQESQLKQKDTILSSNQQLQGNLSRIISNQVSSSRVPSMSNFSQASATATATIATVLPLQASKKNTNNIANMTFSQQSQLGIQLNKPRRKNTQTSSAENLSFSEKTPKSLQESSPRNRSHSNQNSSQLLAGTRSRNDSTKNSRKSPTPTLLNSNRNNTETNQNQRPTSMNSKRSFPVPDYNSSSSRSQSKLNQQQNIQSNKQQQSSQNNNTFAVAAANAASNTPKSSRVNNAKKYWNEAIEEVQQQDTNKKQLDWLELLKQQKQSAIQQTAVALQAAQDAIGRNAVKSEEQENATTPSSKKQERKIFQIQTVIHDFESVISNGLLSTKSQKSPSSFNARFDSNGFQNTSTATTASPNRQQQQQYSTTSRFTSPSRPNQFSSVTMFSTNSPAKQQLQSLYQSKNGQIQQQQQQYQSNSSQSQNLRNKSMNIVEYMSQQSSAKQEKEKSREAIYQKLPSSIALLRSHFSKSPKRRN